MRLWTLHPRYLDSRGLVALWREGLLAQAVLAGATKGYRHHPQLVRFREQRDPIAAMGSYLQAVYKEAQARGFKFDGSKIRQRGPVGNILETQGQLLYEWEHLKRKLTRRDPDRLKQLQSIALPEQHPLFGLAPGPVQTWERVS